jgi:putative ABC transport system permease protein
VLLVACLNLANLLLARFSSRRRELAIRKAMGAGRARIAVEVLAEGVVLAAAGGLVGLWLGTVLLDVLVALFPLDLPRSEEIGISGAVVLFTALTATAAALLATVLPAFRAADEAPATRLGERAETGAGWTRRGLVVIEALLAVVLLSGAVLLTRSVARLQSEDPGFRTDGLVAVDVNVPGTYELERRVAFFRSLEERIEALAGVEDASYTTVLPTAGGGSAAWFNLLDRPAPDGEPPFADYRVVGPDFTAVMGIRLVRGRLPRPEVSRSGPAEVLVDEVLAARFWPDADPVGREVTLGPDGGWIPPSRIVGIVAAVKGASLGGDPPGYVYVPHALTPWWTGMTVVARSSGPRPLSLVDAIRRETAALDPAVPVLDPGTVADRVRESIATERSIATLLGLTAVLALALAAVGLFGLLSYAVARRTRELGIRLALGATPGRVRRDVLGQGVGLAVLGVVPGVALSLLGARLLERWLFGVPATDPVSYLLAALTLVAVAGLASWAPAARATRVEPARSLRED